MFAIVVFVAMLFLVGCQGGDSTDATEDSVVPVSIRQPTPFTYRGKVARMWGGDNFEIIAGTNVHYGYLAEVDTPAVGHFGHQESMTFMRKLIDDDNIEVHVLQRDSFQREVCEVKILADNKNVDAALGLLTAGWAWHDRSDGPHADAYRDAQQQAQDAGLGIWSLPNPVPPWEAWDERNRQFKERLKIKK